MQANELRIGNLVNYEINNSLFQGSVSSVTKNRIVVDKTTLKYYSITPITITEESLIKFGFTCRIVEGYPIYQKGMISIEFYDEGCMWLISDESNIINHIHQLQNLFFALTGEELIIK